jgi:uncharacterized protein (TIGR02246 family)
VAEIEQIARAVADAWNRMDEDEFTQLFTEDVEFYLPRNLLEGGGYEGHEGIRRAMADARESWDEVTVDLKDVAAAGDRAVMHMHVMNRSHGEGPVLEYEGWWALRLRDGLIAYCRSHLDEADALADVGL